MTVRDASTRWTGDLQSGSGITTLDSSGTAQFAVTFPQRIGEPEGTTSPEELIAAAHSACFSMQLSALLGAAGHAPDALHVSVEVDLGPDPAGGFRIPGIRVAVEGEVPGIDEARFVEIAEQAKATCPVSKALAGTEITLEASLA